MYAGNVYNNYMVQGQEDSTTGRVPVLQEDNLGIITGILYDIRSPPEVLLEQSQEYTLSTTRYDSQKRNK